MRPVAGRGKPALPLTGQLSVYLRLTDVPVPQMYGPTADESDFG